MENEKGKVSKGLVIGLIVTTLMVVALVGTTSYFYYNAPKKVQDKMLEGGNINLSVFLIEKLKRKEARLYLIYNQR